jgi:hypothetical protein
MMGSKRTTIFVYSYVCTKHLADYLGMRIDGMMDGATKLTAADAIFFLDQGTGVGGYIYALIIHYLCISSLYAMDIVLYMDLSPSCCPCVCQREEFHVCHA